MATVECKEEFSIVKKFSCGFNSVVQLNNAVGSLDDTENLLEQLNKIQNGDVLNEPCLLVINSHIPISNKFRIN